MPNRSFIDNTLPTVYTAEQAVTNPQTLPGVDNQGADAVTHYILVKTGAASSVATIWDSDDNTTFAAVADPSFIVVNSATDLDLSVAGVKEIAYVGPKRYSAVRCSGGTPTLSTFGLRHMLGRTDKAITL